jgi:hypothetical protein
VAGRSDIAAGKAFIELYVKNSQFVKGLKAARDQLQNFGSAIAKVGAFFTGLGAGILAPLAGAVAHFTKFGSELNDMAARTGVAAGELAELKFAAEQTGASFEDVEAGLRKMAKGGYDVKNLDKIAAEITAIEDPSQRAARAMEVFGKSGTKLIPMLANLAKLRQEARDAGLVPTEESVAAADRIGDAFDKLRAIVMAAVYNVGAAVAPMLEPALAVASNIVKVFSRWAQQNGALIRTIGLIGAGLVVVGTVVTAIGGGILGLGAAFGAAVSTIMTLASAAAFLTSPLVLVVATLAGGVVAWARFTLSGQAAVQAIIAAVGPLIETVRNAIAGIGDALIGGNLLLAGQIAVKGLQLVFLQGLEAISAAIGGILGAAIGDVGTRLIQGDLKGAWESVVKGMAKVWADFAEGIVAIFTMATRAVIDAWQQTQNTITNSLLDQSAQGGVLGKIASMILGVDMQAEQRKSDELNRKLGLGPQNLTEDAKRAAREQSSATADAARGWLDSLDRSFQEQSDAAGSELGERLATGGPSEAAKQLQDELAELRKQAAAAREAAQSGGTQLPGLGPDVASIGGATSSAFSAGGAMALSFGGGGGGPQERMVKAAEATTKKLDVLHQDVVSLKDKLAGLVQRAT